MKSPKSGPSGNLLSIRPAAAFLLLALGSVDVIDFFSHLKLAWRAWPTGMPGAQSQFCMTKYFVSGVTKSVKETKNRTETVGMQRPGTVIVSQHSHVLPLATFW